MTVSSAQMTTGCCLIAMTRLGIGVLDWEMTAIRITHQRPILRLPKRSKLRRRVLWLRHKMLCYRRTQSHTAKSRNRLTLLSHGKPKTYPLCHADRMTVESYVRI